MESDNKELSSANRENPEELEVETEKETAAEAPASGREITLFTRLEKWTVTILMVVLAWASLGYCLYFVKGASEIYKTIEEDGLFGTEIQVTAVQFASMDEEGEPVIQYLTLPEGYFTWLLPLFCLLLAFVFLFKTYSSFLAAIEGRERAVLNLTERVDKVIEKGEGIVLIAALSTMLLIYFLQIILQNFLPSLMNNLQGANWMPQVSTLMVGFVGFFGASLALRGRRHISIDIASRVIPERIMQQCQVILDTGGFVITIIFALLSADYVKFLQEDGANFIKISQGVGVDAHFLSIPDWPFKVFIPVAFGILAYRFLKGSIDGLIKVKLREVEVPAEEVWVELTGRVHEIIQKALQDNRKALLRPATQGDDDASCCGEEPEPPNNEDEPGPGGAQGEGR